MPCVELLQSNGGTCQCTCHDMSPLHSQRVLGNIQGDQGADANSAGQLAKAIG